MALGASTLNTASDTLTRFDVLTVLRRELASSEEVELLCNALQEAWQAIDLLRERVEGEQALMDLSGVAAFAGVNLLKARFGDETARKMILAPSTARRELPPS